MNYIKRTLGFFVVIVASLFLIQNFVETEHFNRILNGILRNGGLNVEFDRVGLDKLSYIEVDNLRVNTQKGERVITAKKARAKISMLMPARLLRIDTYDTEINLKRDKDNHFNVFDILKPDTRDIKPRDRTSRLGRLYINNATVNFEDTSFKEKLEKTLYGVNGFLEVSNFVGFVLEAEGTDYAKTEKIGVKLGDLKRKYIYVNFNFDNVQLDSTLAQYVPVDIVKVNKGRLSGQIEINNNTPTKDFVVMGDLSVQDGQIKYTGIEEDIDIKEAKIKLDTEKIEVFGDLAEQDLEFNGYRLQKLKTKAELLINPRDAQENIFSFKDTEFYFEHELNGFKVKEDVKMAKFDYFIEKKYGEGKFVLENRGSDHDIAKIFGDLRVNDKGELKIKLDSDEMSGEIDVDTQNMSVKINTRSKKAFKIRYNNAYYGINPTIKDLYLDLKSQDFIQKGHIDTGVFVYGNDIFDKPLDVKVDFAKKEGSQGEFEVKSEYGEKVIEYEKLHIKGNIINLSEQKFDIDMKVDEIWLGYQRFKDLKGEITFRDGILDIKDISNDKLRVNGVYNIADGNMSLDIELNNYILYNVSKPELNIYVSRLEGNLAGKLGDLNGKLELNPSKTYLDEEFVGELKGLVEIENNILFVDSLTLRDTELKGSYDLDKGLMDFYLQIKEPELTKLIKLEEEVKLGSEVKLRLNGTLNDFAITGDLLLENLEVKGVQLPNIEGKIEYKNANINKLFKKGILNIEKLAFVDKDNKEIVGLNTSLDFENLDLDYSVQNKKIQLDSIEALKEQGYSGEIDLSFILKGKPENYLVDLAIKSDKLELNGFPVEKVDISVQGNNQGLKIGDFYLEYEKNPLLINGYVTYGPLNYNMSLFLENFNLDFLGLDKNVEKASGIANIDIVFTGDGTEGKILLDNFNYTLKDKSTDVKDLNANIGVLNTKLTINRLDGGYNGGLFKVEGDLDVPKIPKDFLETKKLEIGDFKISAALNNIGIKYGKDIDLALTGNVSLTEDNLFGTVSIDSGEIRNIPSFDKEENISEEERKKQLQQKTIVQSFVEEVIDKIVKQYTVYLNLQAKNNLKLNISNLSLVNGIKGDLLGDLEVHYLGGELNLLGDFSVKNGKFSLNGNRFILNNAGVRFTNINETLSDMNPLIDFEAETTINDEKITIGLNGELKNAELKLKSDSNLSRNQILSLLAFNTTTGKTVSDEKFLGILRKEEGSKSIDESRLLLRSVADTVLNQFVFSPVVRKIEQSLGLTNFSLNTEFNTKSNINEVYSGVAKLYIQNNLYKNKLFWNAEIKFPFQSSKNAKETNDISGSVGYNLWLNYDFVRGIGVKIGGETIRVVEKEKEKLYNKEKRDLKDGKRNYSEKINYYIGVDLSQRAKTFDKLMKKLFYRKKLETLTK